MNHENSNEFESYNIVFNKEPRNDLSINLPLSSPNTIKQRIRAHTINNGLLFDIKEDEKIV